jgi:hypothetical protein
LPAGSVEEFRQLGRRHLKVVEPGGRGGPIANAYSRQTRKAAATTVPLAVGAVGGFERAVGVVRLCDDSSPLARQAVEASKKTPRPCGTSDEPEVVSEHEDRVESTDRLVHLLDREQARISNTPAAADLDRAWRGIDADDLEVSLLEVEGDAASATTGVQHASAHVAHRLAFDGLPLTVGSQ